VKEGTVADYYENICRRRCGWRKPSRIGRLDDSAGKHLQAVSESLRTCEHATTPRRKQKRRDVFGGCKVVTLTALASESRCSVLPDWAAGRLAVLVVAGFAQARGVERRGRCDHGDRGWRGCVDMHLLSGECSEAEDRLPLRKLSRKAPPPASDRR